ncbi:hypothetical protein SPB21_01460 [Leptothoe sp. ISB3NOV94-8A]
MSVNPNQELIWQGRLHLGDEPGVYGDASYSGICAELPITIYRTPTEPPNPQPITSFTLILETEELKTLSNYPGHKVLVTQYVDDPNQQFRSIEKPFPSERFKETDNNRKEITIDIGTEAGPFYLSVQLRCDTTANPGLYDDFTWRRLSLLADKYSFYASLGFIL